MTNDSFESFFLDHLLVKGIHSRITHCVLIVKSLHIAYVTLPLDRSQCLYHPIMVFLCRRRMSTLTGFVRMSAGCSLVSMRWMVIILESTYLRKWCNLTLRCLVRGRYLWTFAISNAPLLSSNTLHRTLALWDRIGNPACFNSCSKSIIGIASRNPYDRPVYSLSVLDNAISVWSWDFHTIRQPP